MFFFIFGFAFHAKQGGTAVIVVTMVTTIGILGSGFFGAGMRAVQEREENILATLQSDADYAGAAAARIRRHGCNSLSAHRRVDAFLAHNLYGMPMPGNLFSLFLFVCCGSAAFRALGLIIAAVVNSSQEANVLIQIVYMPMLLLSGATFPLSFMPNWLQIVTQFIPASYLVIGMSGILQRGESIPQN